MVQYRAIRDLKVNEVFQVAMEFFAEIETFMGVQTRLLHAGNTPQSYIRQWSDSQKAAG